MAVQAQRKILLIEDNPDHALVASRILERAGYAVHGCATGHDGIETCRAGQFDLVLLDYGLPDMDGLAVLEAIFGSGVPVVFVTGRADAKLAVDALRAGAANYIVKDAHYVSKLPEVAKETLDRLGDHLRASGLRVQLQGGDEAAFRAALLRFAPSDAVIVRHAPGDYLIFSRGSLNAEHLAAPLKEADLQTTVTPWVLDGSSSLRDLLA